MSSLQLGRSRTVKRRATPLRQALPHPILQVSGRACVLNPPRPGFLSIPRCLLKALRPISRPGTLLLHLSPYLNLLAMPNRRSNVLCPLSPPRLSVSSSQSLSHITGSTAQPPPHQSSSSVPPNHSANPSQSLCQQYFSQPQVPISVHSTSLPFLGNGQGTAAVPPRPWLPSHPQLMILAPPSALTSNPNPLNQFCLAAPSFLPTHPVGLAPTAPPQ